MQHILGGIFFIRNAFSFTHKIVAMFGHFSSVNIVIYYCYWPYKYGLEHFQSNFQRNIQSQAHMSPDTI